MPQAILDAGGGALRLAARFSQPSRLWLLVGPGVIGVLALFVTHVQWAIALLLPLAVCLLLLVALVVFASQEASVRDLLLVWTLVSFGIHLLVGSLITHTDLVRYFGPDALDYHAEAFSLTKEWRGSGTEVDISTGKEGFYYLLAGAYWLLGPHPIAGLVINAACAAALIPVTFVMTTRLFGAAAARWVPALLTITPAFLVWPSQLLRESPILLLIALAGASAVSLTARLRALPIATLVTALILLFSFRSSVAALMAGGLLVGIGLGLRRLWIGLSLQAVVLAVLAILVVGFGLGYTGFQLASQTDLQDVQVFRAATARDTGSSFGAAEFSSIGAAAATMPIGLARVVLGPLPWEIGLRQAPALLDGIVMWALFVPLVIGIREGWRRRGRTLLPLFFPAVLLAALLAVVIGNYGLLLRERTQAMVLLVPFFALGLERVLGAVIPRRRREFPAIPPSQGSVPAGR